MTTEQYAGFCGPAALASATGLTRIEAAKALLAVGRGARKYGSTNVEALGRALDRFVYRTYRGVGNRHLPTLARWLRENPKKHAILRASHHFVHVKGGKVVEGNGWIPRRGRVTHVIELDS